MREPKLSNATERRPERPRQTGTYERGMISMVWPCEGIAFEDGGTWFVGMLILSTDAEVLPSAAEAVPSA